MIHPVDQYIDDVLSGAQVADKWAKLAIQRHIDDLATGEDRGIWFDPDAAQHAIDFFQFLKHSKGRWAGQVIRLEPWQQFVLWSLFGWMREDSETGRTVRRFRYSYLEVARKNGKSTFAAGIGLYLLSVDGEPGAEVYTAATKRDQARITHAEATRMVKSSPALRKRLKIFKDNIHIVDTASKFEPLGRDADTMDGLNVHGAIIDELHAHKSGELYDILDTATGAREQPLLFSITTAGMDTHSICYELHEYTQNILEGKVEDDSHFGMIYALGDDDDWEDERNWPKANPNLGVSVSLDNLRIQANKAKEAPTRLNAFLRLRMNRWVSAVSRWVDPDKWRACGTPVSVDGLRGRTCYGGLDLSSTTDISAFVLVFPPDGADDPYRVLCRFWIPEEAMHIRSKRDRVPYDVWVHQGWIEATPGNVIDYDYILAAIDEDAERFDLRLTAYDRWGATKLSNDLQNAGHEIAQFGQGYASMSGPMKELEKLYLSGKLAHGGNPVLNWMAGNLVARMDPAGNLKPDKEKSREKIDGMVALIMGVALATSEAATDSVYEERGVITI